MGVAQNKFSYQSDFLSGFAMEIRGETLNYHTLGSQSLDALLVRSLNAADFIEWETQPVPLKSDKMTLSFILLASLQLTEDSHKFDVYLNDVRYFTFHNPRERSLNDISWNGPNKAKMEFTDLEFDKYEDLTGFLYIHVQAEDFPKGKPIRIRVQGESAGSRAWFMVFKHPCQSCVTFSNENVILNTADTRKQSMRLNVAHITAPAKALVRIGHTETEFLLKFGFNSFSAGLDMISAETELPVIIQVGKDTVVNTTHSFKPVIPMTIYLLPHSHVDIGYTHVQDEVKKLQWQHFENAIMLAEQTRNYPEGAKFKWNTEVLWPVESYLASVDQEKQQRFIDAIKNGWIGIDGLYANMLTGLCSPEEWVWMADITRRISQICGIKIESAMISDVPGWSWSMVPMLAQTGMKYLSCGINHGDRIGSTRRELGDKPFYWSSPSGEEKVLTWVHEQGYSAFHYVSNQGSAAGLSVLQPTILNYVNKLADELYPYDSIPLRYTIGSDNGPTDKYLADHVREWNEKYASPKLIIATTAEFFRQFEQKYGEQLPVLSGDITPYWEDGAASSARETALNRESAARLNQAMTLFAQYAPEAYPVDLFAEAWRNVHLYNEHTWGSWNSISEPESDFTRQQWRIKQSFALNASKQADDLLNQVLDHLTIKKNHFDGVDVINTTSMQRTDLVVVPKDIQANIASGLSLVDENGVTTPMQQLSDGSFVFLASEIPARGSRRYFINKGGKELPFEPAVIDGNSLENEFIRIEIEQQWGTIGTFILKNMDIDLVEKTGQPGLGGYLYVNGRSPDNPLSHEKVAVKVKEKGPLVSSFLVQAAAPGCNALEYEIKLIAGINRVELHYLFDKQKIYTPEAVHISFPFHIPDGVLHIENAFGIYQPNKDQLKGSCKNFFTLNNYVDISNGKYGISLISVDVPLIEIGKITNDASSVGWLDKTCEGTTLYSYVMNNYWHTNYCATQEGIANFRYFLYPHNKKFNPALATAQGISAEQPLVVVPVDKKAKPLSPLIRYDNENISTISMQPLDNGKLIWIALYNASMADTNLQLNFIAAPKGIYASDLLKNNLAESSSLISVPGSGLICLLIER
ncbi:MAG: glycoside hydrolase family 38 C-terminal domain-containing protein [Candidatus Zhuqueibacterota bacterium]